MKKILLFLFITLVISACSYQEQNVDKTSLEKQEGIIALKKERDERSKQILLIPDVKEEDVNNKTESEMIKMAQENNGAFYAVSTDKYNEINIGTNVIVYWNGNQEDSDPPQRSAKKLQYS
ncbi:DUF3221 domain-containing protein [Halobacillus andaensis]|uniref:DUF3221 domain-containing protein n=1 Tax=Halobacillus andaensis TaxID=1176239 RepID=UPI003D75A52F